jgi:hypothetical protein
VGGEGLRSWGPAPPPPSRLPPLCAVKQSLCFLFKTLASGAIIGKKGSQGSFIYKNPLSVASEQQAAGLWAATQGVLGGPRPSEGPDAPVFHLLLPLDNWDLRGVKTNIPPPPKKDLK